MSHDTLEIVLRHLENEFVRQCTELPITLPQNTFRRELMQAAPSISRELALDIFKSSYHHGLSRRDDCSYVEYSFKFTNLNQSRPFCFVVWINIDTLAHKLRLEQPRASAREEQLREGVCFNGQFTYQIKVTKQIINMPAIEMSNELARQDQFIYRWNVMAYLMLGCAGVALILAFIAIFYDPSSTFLLFTASINSALLAFSLFKNMPQRTVVNEIARRTERRLIQDTPINLSSSHAQYLKSLRNFEKENNLKLFFLTTQNLTLCSHRNFADWEEKLLMNSEPGVARMVFLLERSIKTVPLLLPSDNSGFAAKNLDIIVRFVNKGGDIVTLLLNLYEVDLLNASTHEKFIAENLDLDSVNSAFTSVKRVLIKPDLLRLAYTAIIDNHERSRRIALDLCRTSELPWFKQLKPYLQKRLLLLSTESNYDSSYFAALSNESLFVFKTLYVLHIECSPEHRENFCILLDVFLNKFSDNPNDKKIALAQSLKTALVDQHCVFDNIIRQIDSYTCIEDFLERPKGLYNPSNEGLFQI